MQEVLQKMKIIKICEIFSGIRKQFNFKIQEKIAIEGEK